MGWIWLKGIKTTKPAKTASLMLDTQAIAWGELPREGSQGRRGWNGGVQALPSIAQFRHCRGRLVGSGDWACLLPFPWVILSGLPPSAGASAWESLACSPSRSQEVAPGAFPPRCTPTFAWCLGHLWPAQSVPRPWALNLGMSPRPTSRLGKGKEESLTATLIC